MRYAWEIHLVKDDGMKEGMCDAHTHGLNEFGSLEIQFVLSYPANMIGYILNEVGTRIKNGLVLEDGMLIEGVCDDEAKLKAYKTQDCFGEEIYRLIMPDGKFKYPEDSKEWPYNLQYESPYQD